MMIVYIFLSILIGAGLGIGYIKWSDRKTDKPVEVVRPPELEISLQDIVHLISLNISSDVSSLVAGFDLSSREPEFYEKYQQLVKHEKELYFEEMLALFSKNKREYVQNLFEHYAGLSTQDVLLLMLTEQQLDNKTIARIMLVNLETLKKRKFRLKQKIKSADIPLHREL